MYGTIFPPPYVYMVWILVKHQKQIYFSYLRWKGYKSFDDPYLMGLAQRSSTRRPLTGFHTKIMYAYVISPYILDITPISLSLIWTT